MSFIIQEIPQPTVFGIGVVEPNGAGGAISFEVGTQDELFFEGNASANFTVDVIFDPTTSLNVAMQDEDVATIHLKVKNGLSPKALESFTIDGQGGSGVEIFFGGNEFFPIYGATSQVYDYAFEITKVSNDNFKVFVGINSDYSEGFNPPAPAFGVSAADSGTGSGATVTFTAGDLGGASGATFTVISNPSGITASASASPITVNGLTILGTYDFTVKTTTIAGQSTSAPSNQITLQAAPGQQAYTTTGSFSWVAPPGVSTISVLAVGAGGAGGGGYIGAGGGGGGLGYKNNISVVPGNSYTVKVNQSLPPSGSGFFDASSTLIVAGYAGTAGTASTPIPGSNVSGGPGGTYLGDGGGNGGKGGPAYVTGPATGNSGAGGGAAGYAGNGGFGGSADPAHPAVSAGAGGGGGGGFYGAGGTAHASAGGGGVGLLGQGPNGAAGVFNPPTGTGFGGGGGSSGTNGANITSTSPAAGGAGGAFGGGGGASGNNSGGAGGSGAVRIIWPGTTRSFPSTNTGNL